MSKITFNLNIEIYITNECNLTCSNCNRFNNYNFKGHYSWKDSAYAIQQWSQRIDAPMITIIGGEPSLHPELPQWTEGVATAWPDRPVMIQTNGLKPIIEMPWWNELTKKFKNIGCGVAVHSPAMKDKLKKSWNNSGGHFDAWQFNDCAIVDCGDYFNIHDNDPEKAFDCCNLKHCHTIFQGRLYKCSTMALLPEFSKQYLVNFSEQQRQLLDSYKSLTHDCSDQDLRDFFTDRDSAIPQCSFCTDTDNVNIVNFDSARKKHKRIDNF
jgi:hypothetical protein